MRLLTFYLIHLKVIRLPAEVFPQSQTIYHKGRGDYRSTLRGALTAGQQVVVTRR